MGRGFGSAAVPSIRVAVRDSNELLLENQVVTGSGTVNTKAVAPKGAKRVAFFLNISAEDSASATTDIDIQISPDQGTTWVDMPQSANSETKASLAQYTTAKSAIKWFEVTGDGLHTRVRANIVTAGHTATDTLTYGPAYWIFSDVD